jgi:predicted dehydrogenase
MKRLKIGVVGCGAIANVHLASWLKIRRAQVVALCDLYEQKAREMSKKWGIKSYYTDMQTMILKEKVEIVDICTPPQSHHSLIIQAAKLGCNILVEKPLTVTSKEAKEVVDAVKIAGVKLCTVHNDKFQPGAIHMISRVKRGEIGKVIGFHQEYLGTNSNPMLLDKNHWCHTLPGGRIGECLPHPIYMLQTFLGNDLRVKAVATMKLGTFEWVPYDELYAVLCNEEGSVGTIHVSFNSPKNTNIIRVYGERGVLETNLYTRTVVKSSIIAPETKNEKMLENVRTAMQILGVTIKLGALSTLGRLRNGHEACISTFIDSILQDRDLPVSLEEAYNNVRICEEIVRRATEAKS